MAATDLFTLSDLAMQVSLNLGATDDVSLAKAKKFVNRALIRFSEMGEWSWQRAYAQSISTVALTEEYSIPNVLKIKRIYLSSPIQRVLTLLEDRQFRRQYPNNTASGTPYYWHRMGWSTATVNTMKIGLYPIPDGVYTVKYDCVKPITLLSSDTDDIRLITGMPSNLVDLVIDGATAIGFKEIDDAQSGEQLQEWVMRLKGAYDEDQYEVEDRLVMAPFDSDNLNWYQDPTLPPNYNE